MSVFAYKIDCLTNLHVGSGDLNYNIIDNEVERDAVTGYPVIHASGLKGALREHYSKKKVSQQKSLDVFGQEPRSDEIKAGSYKFLDAYLLARPMRVSGQLASVMVVSEKSVNDFIRRMNTFGIKEFGSAYLSVKFPENVNFFSNVSGISVEAETTEPIPKSAMTVLEKLAGVIGNKIAIVKDFNEYDLPVIARNYLDNGESKNLWYEEVVPHDSVFYTFILTPDKEMELDLNEIIQIGGHASIGCGFTKFTQLN